MTVDVCLDSPDHGRVRVWGVVVAAMSPLLVVLTACGSSGGNSSNVGLSPPSAEPTGPVVLPLPTDGWKPGDDAELGVAQGKFHAVNEGSYACAWVGDDRRP